MKELRSLDLSNTGIDGSGLISLGKAPLEELDLSGTRLNEGSIISLSSFKGLRRLILGYTILSDRILDRLSTLFNLEFLDLSSCECVSPKRIEKLKGELSRCKIKY